MDAALLFRPNLSSGTPVYLQLVGQVRRGLETGALRPGEALPGIRPVAEALVVHPGAVARAYHELEQLRLAVRVGGELHASALDAGKRPLAEAGVARVANAGADLVERDLRARELASAGEVQQCLLPQAAAHVAGLECAGVSRAARGVTGDYYDFIPLPGQRVAIALGDVCGKGVPAAILMAALRGYLHGATVERQSDPRALVRALNRHLYRSAPASRFATLFYGVYDAAARSLEYVTAGHHPPVLLREERDGGHCLRLDQGGLALGMMPDADYDSARVQLKPGDLLVAFTDGITEAMNAAGDEWGEHRLIDALEAARPDEVGLVADRVLAAAADFTRGAAQHDDMTLVAVRVR
jgi:sigma-B regulation protein RsbU (phosphoserine phosphatase)